LQNQIPAQCLPSNRRQKKEDACGKKIAIPIYLKNKAGQRFHYVRALADEYPPVSRPPAPRN
jgi:hypothetical protein